MIKTDLEQKLKLLSDRDIIRCCVCLCLWIGEVSCSPSDSVQRGSVSNLAHRDHDQERPVFVYAASSLELMVHEIDQLYRQRYPKREVRTVLTGSHTARLQLERGAPPGIFISASPKHIASLDQLGKIEYYQTIAHNELVLLTRSQTRVNSIDQLHRIKRWGLGARRVPVGELAWSLLSELRVDQRSLLALLTPHLITRSLSARALRGRAQRGELDAAVLYRTDIPSLTGWRVVPLPSELTSKHRAHYILALTRQSAQDQASSLAYDWLAIVNSAQGQHVIKKLGFIPEVMSEPQSD